MCSNSLSTFSKRKQSQIRMERSMDVTPAKAVKNLRQTEAVNEVFDIWAD